MCTVQTDILHPCLAECNFSTEQIRTIKLETFETFVGTEIMRSLAVNPIILPKRVIFAEVVLTDVL